MSGKEFLIGFKPHYLKTRDALELDGKALTIQQETGPVFKKASEIGQGNPNPSVVKQEDDRLLEQLGKKLNTILGTGKTPLASPRPL